MVPERIIAEELTIRLNTSSYTKVDDIACHDP